MKGTVIHGDVTVTITRNYGETSAEKSNELLFHMAVAIVSVSLLVFPMQMPPPPGRSVGYPLQVAIDGSLYGMTLLAMLVLACAASALVARRTVAKPVVDALAHV